MKKRYAFPLKTCLRFGLASVLTCCFALKVNAQTAPLKQWDRTFGGIDADSYPGIIQTPDGGYLVSGTSFSGIGGDKSGANLGINDVWLIKVDANGNKTWDKTFGGNRYDGANRIVLTPDGGYLLGGSSDSDMGNHLSQACKGYNDYWVLKLDAAGNKLWDKRYGGPHHDGLSVLKKTADGGYILGGHSWSDMGGDKSQAKRGPKDYWVVKIDAAGNKLWDKTFGSPSGESYLTCLVQTSDGGYMLGGWSDGGIGGDKSQASKGEDDYWVIRLDATGNKLWDKTIGGDYNEALFGLAQTPDGGFLLAGNSLSGVAGDKSVPSKGNGDQWVVKLDASGNKLWDKAFGGQFSDWVWDLLPTADGGFVLGGQSLSGISGDKTAPLYGDRDLWLVKIDAAGNKRWDKSLGGTGFDEISGLAQARDGGLLIAASTDSPVSTDKSQPSRGGHDFWIIKLVPEILSVQEADAGLPLQISPNPSKGKFNLQLSNLTAPSAEVTVADLLGRVVLQKEIQVNDNRLSEEITLPNAKGMYLLQVKAGETLATRKIVVE